MDPLHLVDQPPSPMVRLDMEMPIARSVNTIGVTEIGQLGTAIRSDITMYIAIAVHSSF